MNVSCPECQSVYRVDPAKVTGANLRARCSICGGLIPVGASVRWADDFPSSMVRSVEAGARTVTGAAGTSTLTSAGPNDAPPATDLSPAATFAPAPFVPPVVTPRAASPTMTVPPATPPAAPAAPARPSDGGARDAASSLGAAPAREAGAARIPPFAPPRRPTPVTPASVTPSTMPSTTPPTLRPPTPAFVPSPALGGFGAPIDRSTPRELTPEAPISAPPSASAAPSSAPAAPSSAPVPPGAPHPRVPDEGMRGGAAVRPSMAGSSVPPVTASGSSVPATGATPAPPARRPINPFLSNDPNQKARRLARALVSDMVAYHPQKREEGARNGTLKQLFREEIKKSYEEYVEQVGREFAESTTHFQEALNDILAGGKRIF